jgi:hypothetical protein
MPYLAYVRNRNLAIKVLSEVDRKWEVGHEFGRLCAVLTRSLAVRLAPTCEKGELGVQRLDNQSGRLMAKNNSTSSNKESSLSIRVDPERKAVIARAAKQHGHTISEFVLENAYQMATKLLADVDDPLKLFLPVPLSSG